MDDFIETINAKLDLADHALLAFSRSKNPKLLLAAMRFIHTALIQSLNHFLQKKKLPMPSSFKEKLHAIAPYLSDSGAMETMNKINSIIQNHRKSSMVFTRKEQLMICESDYSMIVLDKKSVEDHLTKAKVFIKRMVSM